MKLADRDQVEKERKEKGFALYVNGANSKTPRTKTTTPSPRVPAANLRIASG